MNRAKAERVMEYLLRNGADAVTIQKGEKKDEWGLSLNQGSFDRKESAKLLKAIHLFGLKVGIYGGVELVLD